MSLLRLWLVTLTSFFLISAAHATLVLPLDLVRLQHDAQYVFLGDCLANKVELDPVSGRVATFTTFQVIENFKGNLSATYTIKQVGGNLPDSPVTMHIEGVPRFEVGKRYMVFLPAVSVIGFSSPVGLMQGVFSVGHDASGQETVSNGRDFSDLLQALTPGQIPPRVAAKLGVERNPANARARASIRLDDMRTLLQGMPQP